MNVVRSWLRGLLGASGVTLLVPAGLLAAVAVAATVGGSGLGSVGQLLGGPEVPGGLEAALHAQANAGDDLPTVPTRKRDRGARGRTAGAGARGGSSSTGRASADDRRAGSSGDSTQNTSTTQPTSTQSTPPPRTTTTTQTQPTTPPTTTQPTTTQPAETNPVRQLGKTVQDIVRPLPVVGPTAADAVGTVIDLVAPPPK